MACVYISTASGKLYGKDWLETGKAVYNAYVYASLHNIRYPLGNMFIYIQYTILN